MKGSKVRILDHFEKYGILTSMEAIQLYGITRLAARIKDLRDMGYNISTIMTDGINRYEEPVRYAVYKYNGRK